MAGGFHHDAKQWSLLPAAGEHSEDDYVFVNVSQYVPDGSEAEPRVVELTDKNHPAVILTPSDQREVATALLASADRAEAAGTCPSWTRPPSTGIPRRARSAPR
jgi:hypothetical protein